MCTLTLYLLALSGSATARTVEALVGQWARSPDLRGAKVGVSVVDLDSGDDLAAYRAEEPLFAASLMKLATTAAALRFLPTETNWTTAILADIHDEEASGPLVLLGQGAPKLTLTQLESLADQLSHAGLKRAEAGIMLDRSCCGPSVLPPGFDMKTTDAGYRAQTGALVSNFGAIGVEVSPSPAGRGLVRVKVDGGGEHIHIRNSAQTVAGSGSTIRLRMSADPQGDSLLEVSGALGRDAKAHRERKALINPDRWTGRVLRSALRSRGLDVGPVYFGDLQELPHRGSYREVAKVEDQGLAGTVKDINTWSNNFMAETLLLRLGCQGIAPCDWARAVGRVNTVLDDLEIASAERHIVNGSGLYQASKLSARATTTLLVAMANDDVFRSSMAIPGKPGTLSRRLKSLGRGARVMAKTGTLDEVVGLAGYLTTTGGKTLAFSVIVNRPEGLKLAATRKHVDRLIRRLARRR